MAVDGKVDGKVDGTLGRLDDGKPGLPCHVMPCGGCGFCVVVPLSPPLVLSLPFSLESPPIHLTNWNLLYSPSLAKDLVDCTASATIVSTPPTHFIPLSTIHNPQSTSIIHNSTSIIPYPLINTVAL